MISVTMHFDPDTFQHMIAVDTLMMLADMIELDPRFFVTASDEIEIRGPFGKGIVK